MKILKVCNLLLTILAFKTSFASPFESNSVNEQLPHRSISVDRFDRLENEISDLKGIVGELRQKLAKFESSGPSTKDDARAPRKGNSVDYSSPALPAAAIAGPFSCQELLELNNDALRTNGFYIVGNKAFNRMMVVNCNFDNAVRETFIGNLDMKTTEVHFYVQRTTSLSTSDAIVTFDFDQLNIGGAMDSRNGFFTAPVAGIYHFSFSGIKDADTTSVRIELRLNYFKKVELAYATNLNSILSLCTINASLKLKAGDVVTLNKVGAGTLYNNAEEHTTHFTGWLEQEDLTFV